MSLFRVLDDDFSKYAFPLLTFFIFQVATDGDAPSISATFKILRTLIDFCLRNSVVICWGAKYPNCYQNPAQCFLPTPQKMLLSPSLGNRRRYELELDLARLNKDVITFYVLVFSVGKNYHPLLSLFIYCINEKIKLEIS